MDENVGVGKAQRGYFGRAKEIENNFRHCEQATGPRKRDYGSRSSARKRVEYREGAG